MCGFRVRICIYGWEMCVLGCVGMRQCGFRLRKGEEEEEEDLPSSLEPYS